MRTRIIIFLALFAALACREKMQMNFPYKENMVILTELTNYTENIKVIVRKTFPVSTKKKTPKQYEEEQKKMQKVLRRVKIRVFGGDNAKNKTLITDKFSIKTDRTFSENQEFEYYLSEKITPVKPGRYYWLEVEHEGRTYLTDPQKMKSSLKNVKSGIYKSGETRYFRIFYDDPPEVNFYRLEHSRIATDTDKVEHNRYHGTFSDVMVNGKKQAYLIFDELDLDEEVNHGSYKYYYHFIIKNMDYPTYKFLKLAEKQDRSVDGSPAFGTVPANLTGNIYEKETKKPTIGNFNVISVTTIRKMPVDLKKK